MADFRYFLLGFEPAVFAFFYIIARDDIDFFVKKAYIVAKIL